MTREGGNHSSLRVLGTGIALEGVREMRSPKALVEEPSKERPHFTILQESALREGRRLLDIVMAVVSSGLVSFGLVRSYIRDNIHTYAALPTV